MRSWTCVIALGLLWSLASCAAIADVRVEPPSWWVGMHERSLQLMMHGPGIAEARAETSSPEIRITAQHRLSSPNYLFVDLEIDADAGPGTVAINLSQAGRPPVTINYPLHARRQGSAERPGFGPADVIYLLVPDRFANGDPRNDNTGDTLEKRDRHNPGGRHGGDLAGMRAALPYLQNLGITQIWPTPLIENDMPAYSYHGYAATDLYRIDPRFGSNEDYRDYVAAARERGIGVIQDIVLNHIGSQHWWMADLPSPDWINGAQFSPTNHARTTLQDPYAAASDRAVFSHGWFVDTMTDLNQRNPFLATYLIQNSLWWIEYAGLSGIREDTYSYADPDFLAAWSKRIVQEYPSFSIVGEEWSRNPTVVSYWQAGPHGGRHPGSATNSMMDFPLYYNLVESLQTEGQWEGGLMRLYQSLVNDTLYPAPERLVLFDGNHDTPRLYSILGEDFGKFQAALTYILTMPRTPQLFYGTELAMTSPTQRDDGRVRADFPGGWPGDRADGFIGKGLSGVAKRSQTFVRSLLQFRRQSSALTRGKLIHFVPENGVYVYARQSEQQTVLVVINRSGKQQTVATRRFDEVLRGHATAQDIISKAALDLSKEIVVPADAVRILALEAGSG